MGSRAGVDLDLAVEMADLADDPAVLHMPHEVVSACEDSLTSKHRGELTDVTRDTFRSDLVAP
jgi:hypothetical protein